MSSSHSLVPYGNAAARAAAPRPLHVAARARHSAPCEVSQRLRSSEADDANDPLHKAT